MKRTYSFLPAAALLLAAACSPSQPAAESDFTRFVDPKIGTGGHGHVFVGANVPFGMVQVGPTSIPQEWDWVSGYHRSDSTVIGFSHTHLSGTGIGDLFDVRLIKRARFAVFGFAEPHVIEFISDDASNLRPIVSSAPPVIGNGSVCQAREVVEQAIPVGRAQVPS